MPFNPDMNQLLKSFSRFAFLGILLLACVLFFYFHLYDYLTLTTLKHYQSAAQEWTNLHYNLAVGLYVTVFVLLIACAIPCATFMTLLGGFLFSSIAILYAEFSITFGGMLLFLAVRTAIGSRIAAKKTGWIKIIEAGFRDNAFNYLVTLRLVPIFPCWISNIAAGMLNVPLKTFIIATALGILPSTVIYALAGRGLDKIITDEKTPLLNLIFTPSVLFPLLGLALLSLAPVIYKFVKKPDQNR
jgi:uncharacterized membrane protein YdjX (TVP38/TMEM64 family)